MSESNVIPEARFYNERLLSIALPEMEAERVEHREAITKLSPTDPEGSKLLSQCYDVFMGALVGSVRKNRGGLVPYAMLYTASSSTLATPEDPHLLAFAYRDPVTDANFPIIHVAVVHLDASHPAVGDEITEAMVEKVDNSMDKLAESYREHVKDKGAESLIAPSIFYQPLMTVYNYLIGSDQLSDRMIDAPEGREEPNTFFPFEVYFNDEDSGEQGLSIRLVQIVEEGPALAVELALRLDDLDKVIQHEKSLRAERPPTQSIH